MKEKLKKHKKWIWLTAAALVVVILIVSIASCNPTRSYSGPQSAAVERGDISTSIVGSGTLAFDSSLSLKLPTDLTIDRILVTEGEFVSAGDALAELNYASLLESIGDMRSELNSLDSQIASASNTTKTEYVYSNVSGRVKGVYAEKGDSAAAIMGQHGSLALLSIDGKMAVDIAAGAELAIGDEVVVALSDGSEKTGTVAEIGETSIKITLSDNGPELGEMVSVQTTEGKALGGGVLYVNQPLTVLGSGGTISAVYVAENQYVYSGNTMFVLSDVPNSATYQQLIAERGEVAEALSLLVSAANNGGTLMAPFSGVVQSIGVTGANDVENDPAASSGSSGSSGSSIYDYMSVGSVNSLAGAFLTATQPQDPGTKTAITDLSMLELLAPVAGATPTTQLNGLAEYKVSIVWLPADAAFGYDTIYTASYTLSANSGYYFAPDTTLTLKNALVTNITVSDDGDKLTFIAVYSKTAAKTDTGAQIPNYDLSGLGNYLDYGSYGDSADLSSSLSGYSSSYSAADTTQSELLTAAFGIATDQDDMVLSISVDELDILKIAKGQPAVLTFDALSNSYEGTIIRIASGDSSSSGVTKYRVDIAINRSGDMRAGMNATATIHVGTAQDVLMIPVSALQEMGGRVFVYTQYDESSNELSGEVEVETGLSDGDVVEIVSGLSEGDMVYYNETVSNDMFAMFGMGNRNE